MNESFTITVAAPALSPSVEKIFLDAQERSRALFNSTFSHLNLHDYSYTTTAAKEELGLDEELVLELIDDYVAQIIKAVKVFEKQLLELQSAQDRAIETDFTPFRELVHKNLGVARNLRIEDAKALLVEMMHSEDILYLRLCIELLELCAVMLNPTWAYKTYKLIELKSSI